MRQRVPTQPQRDDCLVRRATEDDLPSIHELHGLCFPDGSGAGEAPAPDVLETNLRHGRVWVAVSPTGVLGFLCYEKPLDDHIFLGGLAVRPAAQGNGVAAALLDTLLSGGVLDSATKDISISTAVGLRNLAMLGLLLSRGFIGRTVMKDYFGAGQDRLYLQFKHKTQYVDADERYLVPCVASAQIFDLLSSGNHAITALVHPPSGPTLEVCFFEPDDVAALESDETAASVAFSSAMLAAITFLLGFSFQSQSYPDGVRMLLIGATLVTTVSLAVYANTSGELSRVRANKFDSHTRFGNVLSEYGGIYPFLASLPPTFAAVSQSTIWPIVTAALFSGALAVYELSGFALSSRYPQTWFTRAVSLLICAAPLGGVLGVRSSLATWVWATALGALLVLLSLVYLYRRPGESSAAPPRPWQIRRQ